MMFGTCNFVDYDSAVRYYHRQQIGEEWVLRKLKCGEIQIGKPRLCKGEELKIDPSEGRYLIKEYES